MPSLLRTSLRWIPLVSLFLAWPAGRVVSSDQGAADAPEPWRVGSPIVSYWAGPPMTDSLAGLLADGNWNLVWCRGVEDLNLARKHGLRGIVSSALFRPATLDDPNALKRLDEFLATVKGHPALYALHLRDEPSASDFAGLARMKAYLDRKAPQTLKYVNLFPNYANARQLGTQGEPVHTAAYEEHLRRFIREFQPQLISYDHYHFSVKGDGDRYFLNLAQVRRAAQDTGVPFMVIVQACSWTVNMRIPTCSELRWLVYTTLAYGSQGISYYVLGHPGHDGAMIHRADGSPTPLYHAARRLNKEFAAIATELQPLRSIAVYHAGTLPEGTVQLPDDAPFRIEPSIKPLKPQPNKPVQGYLVGLFGKSETATHALVVNLDYRTYAGLGQPRREEFLKPVARFLIGQEPLERFDVKTSTWQPAGGNRTELRLPPSGAVFVRTRSR